MTEAVHVDRALVRRILAGDQAAFRGLFDSFFPRLYRFALARLDGDHDAANEVIQQTFCKAIERLESYRGEAALYTWFCQVCRNTLVDYYRAKKRERANVVLIEDRPQLREILEAFTAPAAGEPATSAWQRDVARLVQATVDMLPDRYGEVLEWKYVDGLSVKEIAGRLEIGAKAAESILGRARTAFKEAILAMVETPDILQPPHQS